MNGPLVVTGTRIDRKSSNRDTFSGDNCLRGGRGFFTIFFFSVCKIGNEVKSPKWDTGGIKKKNLTRDLTISYIIHNNKKAL